MRATTRGGELLVSPPLESIFLKPRNPFMKRVPRILILSSLSLIIAISLQAAEKEDAVVRSAIERVSGGKLKPDSITPAPVEGWYEVVLGSDVVYVSNDGRYLMNGDLIEIGQRRNLTDERRTALYKAAIDEVDESSMIVYAPKQVKHTVTIFTDIDCPYCRKLHKEMQSYLDAGIKVRYLAFPRAGVGSDSYEKAVSVWCAKDPAQAMTLAKNGEKVESRSCTSPVDQHLALVRQLGVNATPTIFLEDGRRVPGYVPAQRLLRILEQGKR